MNTIARLKELRQNNNLTQKDFAEKIGISRTYYSNIENGSMPLTPQILDMICFKFKINKDWLLYGTSDINIPNTDDSALLTDKYNMFKDVIDKLILEADSNEFEYIVNAFSYFASILSIHKKNNSIDYLSNVSQICDLLEKYCFSLSTDKIKANNYEKLYNLKLREEQMKTEINQCINNITASFVK